MTDRKPETPDIKALLGRALTEVRESKARLRELEAAAHAPIAIIGMDCRFPGEANSPAAFWQLLQAGRDGIVRVPADRWDADAYYDPDPDTEGRIATRHGGFINDIDRFDAHFFGISPREAESMDPQHRLLLETAWRALENANLAPSTLRGSATGVFIGICTYDYAIRHLSGENGQQLSPYFGTGNALSAAAGRLAYVFAFNGPTMAIDTACSSSLVSIHQACQALRRGECSTALAGGVNLLIAPQTSINFSRAHMLAPDGQCKAFSEQANGYSRGEGCGLVVLKRLDHALRDQDPVLAVIRGSAVNQDGASSGLTVPNGPAQQAVIRLALADAGIEPASVSYVEAHGTGTPLGDPIEAGSLAAVYGPGRQTPLKLGSVKSNIGHLEGAAGVAGLIKTVLALQHRRIPASLHAQQTNSQIDWSTLELNRQLCDWPAATPRRAGISAFGFTGTNAHLVIEETPLENIAGNTEKTALPLPATLFPLSAKDPQTLQQLSAVIATFLAERPVAALQDYASVAAHGREHFAYRRAVIGRTAADAASQLLIAPAALADKTRPARQIAFIFSGQGSQYAGMGRTLYDSQPVFRDTLERCDLLVSEWRGQSLLPILFDPAQAAQLKHTAWTQVALYSIECALVALWRSWGIHPAMVTGHSVGAYAAAQTAGVFSLEDGLRLVCARASLMGSLPAGIGAMAAVRLPESALRPLLAAHQLDLEIACINASDALVLSGSAEALARFERVAEQQQLNCQRLNVSHAFHCQLLDPILEPLRQTLAGITLNRPQLPFVSDHSGQLVSQELTTADYWVRHTRETVRFAAAIDCLAQHGQHCFLEIGPGSSFIGLARRALPTAQALWLHSLDADEQTPLHSLARLYENGADPDWSALYDRAPLAQRRLPAYPFYGQRHWLDEKAPAIPASRADKTRRHPLLGERLQLAADNAWRFANTLHASGAASLADHQVGNRVVVPAAGLLEIFLAAGQQALASERLCIEDFHIDQALLIDHEQPIQTVLNANDDGSYQARLFADLSAAPRAAPAWQQIAGARIRLAQASDLLVGKTGDSSDSGDDSQPSESEDLSVADFYEACRQRGLNYGPAFQALRRVQGRAESLPTGIRAEIEIKADQRDKTGAASGGDLDYLLHPALFDACLQAASNAYPLPPAGELYIPVGLRRLVVHAAAPAQLTCLARSIQTTATQIETHLQLSDKAGRIIAVAEGVQLQRTSSAALGQTATRARPPLQHLQAVWQALPAPTIARPPRQDETILLLHPPGAAPQALTSALPAQSRITLASELPVDGQFTRIVLCCPAAIAPADLPAWLADTLLPVLHLAEQQPGLRRLLLLTHGAQGVDKAPEQAELAAIWGVIRSVRAEQPALAVSCADSDDDARSLAAIASDLLADSQGDLAYRRGQRFSRAFKTIDLPQTPPPVRADRSYLITGGQGEIARHIAHWLVEQGARNLAILSRRPQQADPFWDALAEQAQLCFITADIGDGANGGEVAAAFARIAAELPPLAVIFHTAGLRQDAALANLDTAHFAAVLRPKVLGTWQLYQQLEQKAQRLPLDAVICFSSIAATFGAAGQANYAAANAWLDAFAPWARARGVPMHSLSFGPWDDTGLVRELTPRQREEIVRRGVDFQSVAESLNTLGRFWQRSRSEPDAIDLIAYRGQPAPADHPPPRGEPSQSPASTLLAALAGILRLPPQQIDLDTPLVALGLDSLMAMELRAWCKRHHRIDIPTVDLIRDATLRQIEDRLHGTPPATSLANAASNKLDASTAAIGQTTPQTAYPLTRGQTALWYLQRMAPAAVAYNIALSLRVRSTVDEAALCASLSTLARRHDMLCSIYPESADGPQRRIDPAAGPQFRRYPADGLSDAQLLAQVGEDYRQPFDLAHGPVLRVSLHSRAADEHVLLLVLHHIAADAWSLWRLLEELRDLYAAARSGQPLHLPAPAYRFAEHVSDEAAYLDSPQALTDGAYWQQELSGENGTPLPVLQLPTDRPRPKLQRFNGASTAFSLSESETSALKTLAQQHGTTLYGVLLAAYQCLLHRYSGQNDILVGCPTAGRNLPESAATIGYFVNPIVLRARFAPALRFNALLQDVRQRLLDGMAHQDFPFPLLAERLSLRLGSERNEAYPPVFQAAFVMQQLQQDGDFSRLLAPSTPPVQVDWGGLLLEFCGLPQQEGQFDLTLEMVQADGVAHGLFKYNSDLWLPATMGRLAEHFRCLLQAVIDDPTQAVDRLNLLPAHERQTLLQTWNATQRPYDLERPLHRWIESQVARTPDAVAAEIDGRHLSYAELNAAANRLALRLHQAGVAGDDLIGLCAERSLEMLVGLLATLKAGAAYVPLDTTLPPERLGLMIDDAAPKIILCTAATQGMLPTDRAALWSLAECNRNGGEFAVRGELVEPQAPVSASPSTGSGRTEAETRPTPLLADNPDSEVNRDPGNPSWSVAPAALAYTIYTSGSTGQPKGVMNSHRGIVNRLLWMQETFALTTDDRVLQKTPYSFDVSVWEFFWPLMFGARLVFARPEGHRDNTYLAELIQSRAITTLHFVPPMLQAFLEAPGAAACHSLRRVICSGQELPASLQSQFFQQFQPGCQLHNLYGPTEAAVDVSWHPCQAGDTRHFVPIGKPIANTTLYILDALGQPVPIGLPGELHIGGVQVARGYLKREALTAERFIPDLFAPDGQHRLYRTGDLARFDADGNIQFLGRNDFQIKIRGLRVELGEIEHALTSRPEIRDAVVLLREDRPGVQQLVAYCVSPTENAGMADTLRADLARHLPQHMIPDHFVWLAALPLGQSGKVDRRALPAPAVSTTPRITARPPGTASEILLADICKDLLKLNEVGIDDNFFSLGGDSIKSTQLVYRATRAGFTFGVREVLQTPTIAALATWRGDPAAATAQRGDNTGNAADSVADESAALPLLPMQSWFFAAATTPHSRFNQAVLLHTAQALDAATLQLALADLVSRHQALRLRFPPAADGRPQAILVAPAAAAFRFAHWSTTSNQPLATAIAASQEALNLEHGPLTAALLINAPEQPALLLLAHHLIIDGVSWRTLISDLDIAYRAHATGQSAQFTAPPAYVPWLHTVQNFAASPAAEAEAMYWLCEDWAAARPLLPELPLTENVHSDGAACGEYLLQLPLDPADAAISNEHYEALLLATLAEALAEILADSLPDSLENTLSPAPLRIDMEGHGRQPIAGGADGSRVIGWCTALYPVLLPPGSGALEQRVAAVARHLAEVPAGGRAFGLCRHLSPRPALRQALARIAPAELLFNYLGQLDNSLPADSLFRFTPIVPEALRDTAEEPRYPLEINAFRFANQLHLSLRHHRRQLNDDGVNRLARRWQAALQAALHGHYGLTPMQQGILFHSLLQPAAGFYITQLLVELHGELDSAALQAAWENVFQRHPVLRHGFAWKGQDAPKQWAADNLSLPWQTHDWQHVSAAEQATRLDEFLAADRRRGFDLAQPPLLRINLLQRSTQTTLLWTHHHLLLDGRSMFLVLAEVLDIYRATRAGQTAQLAPPGNFRQFVASLASHDRDAALTYWKSQLANVDGPTTLPFLRRANALSEDLGAGPNFPNQFSNPPGRRSGFSPTCRVKTRPTTQSHFAECRHRLTLETSTGLYALSRRHGVSLNLLLQTLLAVLLQRLSGSRRVIFGSTVASARPADSVAHAEVGLFINTLPVVFDQPGTADFGDCLQQARLDQAARLPFEQTPLVDILACSGLASGQALFELLFLFENYSVADSLLAPLAGLQVGEVRVIERNHYPLTLSILPHEQISLQLTHDEARYPAAAAQLFLLHYQHLLETLAEPPNTRPDARLPLAQIELLDPAWRQTLLHGWNDTALPVAATCRADSAFLAQAAARPTAIAVRYQGESWTYAQLAGQARQIAGALQAQGIGPGMLVGLCTERSPTMLAALYGILLAGAAYVPLDPGFPADRLAYMLEDSGARLTLSEIAVASELRQRLASAAPLLLLDELPATAAFTELPPAGDAAPMYVIYTSGSTGLPKGVVLPHGAVANFLASMARTPGLDAGDRLLAVTTLSFDIAVLELFLPLSQGGCVVLANRAAAIDPRRLMRLLEDEKITIMQATPATWRMLLAAGWPGRRELKVLCGGEALPGDLGQALLRCCGAVWNMYGPTETTVWSAIHPLSPGSGDDVEPIGRPIANTRLYLLDEQGQPVLPGVVGELYIGGHGVALGYHRRPALTEERFVADPFSTESDARMYRTGDLARWRYDGVMEFLGRTDSQVKLRGFRIELGEIESLLGSHPAIAHCVVVIRPDAAGEPTLLAYFTPFTPLPGVPADERELRHLLRERLPEYMVPARFIPLASLPLTPNGKVDRQALPPPPAVLAESADFVDSSESTSITASALSDDPLEGQIAAIWSQLLGRSNLPPEESFFNLGGNSLQLVTLQSRLIQHLGIDLDIVDLFRHPSIRQQAWLLRRQQTPTASPPQTQPPAAAEAGNASHRPQATLRRNARQRE